MDDKICTVNLKLTVHGVIAYAPPIPAALVCRRTRCLLSRQFVLPNVLNCRVNRQSRRFRSPRHCMNFANAIPPKINRQSTTNSTMLFVGVGRFSGNLAVEA
jgi:hypothetical protein